MSTNTREPLRPWWEQMYLSQERLNGKIAILQDSLFDDSDLNEYNYFWDMMAVLLDEHGHLSCDDNFVFYNSTNKNSDNIGCSESGAVFGPIPNCLDYDIFVVDFDRVPANIHEIILVHNIYESISNEKFRREWKSKQKTDPGFNICIYDIEDYHQFIKSIENEDNTPVHAIIRYEDISYYCFISIGLKRTPDGSWNIYEIAKSYNSLYELIESL